MDKKVCTVCKDPLPLDNFNVNRSKADGRSSHCRECGKRMAKDYYREHQAKMVLQIATKKGERIERNLQHIATYLLTHPCVDCGESNPIVLEFDHVRGTKRMDVSKMAADGYLLERLEEEIAKCDVRCANCHRIKTAKERNNRRYRDRSTTGCASGS